MNSDKVISNINNILNPIRSDSFVYGLDYNKIIKNNDYRLLRITPSENIGSKYLAPLDISLSIGITEIDSNLNHELHLDKYDTNSSKYFDNLTESVNNRFELYDNSVNYLHSKNIDNFSINSKTNNIIDISMLKNINGEMSELEYKNIPVFKDDEMTFDIDEYSNSLSIDLDSMGPVVSFQTGKNALSLEQNLEKIISSINSSKMEKYLKDRYIRRIEVYRKNKDEKYITTLKKKVTDAIDSISRFSYSSALKSRYSKIKSDYIYLNLLLLIL